MLGSERPYSLGGHVSVGKHVHSSAGLSSGSLSRSLPVSFTEGCLMALVEFEHSFILWNSYIRSPLFKNTHHDKLKTLAIALGDAHTSLVSVILSCTQSVGTSGKV